MEKDKQLSDATGVLWERFRLIREGIVPRKPFEGMSDEAFLTFMEEPDPKKWPKEMKPLKRYLKIKMPKGHRMSSPYSRGEY